MSTPSSPHDFTADSSTAHRSTIDAEDVARFTAIANEWWDEKGKFAPLHRLNAARIQYLQDQILAHLAPQGGGSQALSQHRLLDVGCGGGLIAEPMARLGLQVTAIDAGERNVQVARAHAEKSGLTIDYRACAAETLAATGEKFDVVLALEIIEHVADVEAFYDALVALLKPNGLLILSTINRTKKSYLMAIIGAEYVLRWLPRGTHNWHQFIKPSEMAAALSRRGLQSRDVSGILFNPLMGGFQRHPRDLDVNYMMTLTRE